MGHRGKELLPRLTFRTVGAAVGTIGAYSTGNVFGCGGGLIVVGTTVYKLSQNCPDNGAGDGTIGWG